MCWITPWYLHATSVYDSEGSNWCPFIIRQKRKNNNSKGAFPSFHVNVNEVDRQLKFIWISMHSKVKVCDQQKIDKLWCDLLKRKQTCMIAALQESAVQCWLHIFALWKYYVLNYVYTECDIILQPMQATSALALKLWMNESFCILRMFFFDVTKKQSL